MTTLIQRVRRVFWRTRPPVATAPDRPPVAAAADAVRDLDLTPSDPLLGYLQQTPGVIDFQHLRLDSPMVERLRAAGVRLAVPLLSQGELIGLLTLGPRRSEQEYSSDDRTLLGNLASQAAPALRVAQLVRQQQREARERERIAQELRVARLIQQTLLPRSVPAITGWGITPYYEPAREVGGDFYDFIELGDGKLGLVIADVTDKGVPAALVMAMARSILRAAAGRLDSPGAVLTRVNEVLYPDMPPNMFVTCLYAIIDTRSGHVQFANAGHDLPYWHCAGSVRELYARVPLGLMPGMPLSRFAWGICAMVAVATMWQLGDQALRSGGRMSLLQLLATSLYSLLPVSFSALGALVITRQPRNTVGWLMIAPALETFLKTFSMSIVGGVDVPPTEPSIIFLLAIWVDRITWVFSVFPLLLILLLFPTGRPPTQRWNRLVFALAGLQISLVLVVGFGQSLLPFDETWRVANPIGVIPDAWVDVLYSTLLQVVLGVLALLSARSLFVRYTQGSLVEKLQIKWIASASAIFGALYLVTVLTVVTTGLRWGSADPVALAVQLPSVLTLNALPVVIAVAILRYRLFDIDIIIRRTLVYTVLTLTLGATYLVGVVALQALFVRLTGQESALAVVASTLTIAALFGPLRRRVQAVIDRRFFRRKYDAQQVLEQFALRAQQQVDLDVLSADVVGVVQETLEPEGAQLWLVRRS